jgi:hypothetical protein
MDHNKKRILSHSSQPHLASKTSNEGTQPILPSPLHSPPHSYASGLLVLPLPPPRRRRRPPHRPRPMTIILLLVGTAVARGPLSRGRTLNIHGINGVESGSATAACRPEARSESRLGDAHGGWRVEGEWPCGRGVGSGCITAAGRLAARSEAPVGLGSADAGLRGARGGWAVGGEWPCGRGGGGSGSATGRLGGDGGRG